MWSFSYVFIRKQWFQRPKSLSNYKGNLGKVHIRPTKIKITFFLGEILHRVFFYSMRILPMLQTSENKPPGINNKLYVSRNMSVRATAIDLHMGVMRMGGGGRAYVLFLNMSLFLNIGPLDTK